MAKNTDTKGMTTDSQLARRLTDVQGRIRVAAKAAEREVQTIRLLAVSKAKPAEAVRALASLGVTEIAENYLAEGLAKQAQLADIPGLCWHFIGRVQSNKTAQIATHFSWVQSVDRLKIARRLSESRPQALPSLNLCVQVNLDAEPQKSGVLPEEAFALCRQIAALPNLRLRGLMAVPSVSRTDAFTRLSALYAEIGARMRGFDTLSMGMSADFEQAIAAGSTLVRLGTALFGERPSKSGV